MKLSTFGRVKFLKQLVCGCLVPGMMYVSAGISHAADKEPAPDQSKEGIKELRTLDEVNVMLSDMALRLQDKQVCTFGGELRGSADRSMKKSVWYDYAGGFYVRRNADNSVIHMMYKDSTRILAAAKDASLVPKLEKKEKLALREAQRIIKEIIRPGMTEMEKARAIHDYMIKHYSYNSPSGGAACTMLLTNKGVCEAYSRVYQLLVGLAGMDVHTVLGRAGGAHAWNLVKVDGEWFHVDVTWDDCCTPSDKSSEPSDKISYKYFLVNDKQIKEDHTWKNTDLPESSTKDAAFYRRNKRYFASYNSLWKAVDAAAAQKKTFYEAYLSCFVNKDTFLRSYEKACTTYPRLKDMIGWCGPTEKAGVVSLRFDFSDHSEKKLQEVKPNLVRETLAEARAWLSDDALDSLKSLIPEKEWNELKQKGEELKQKGIDIKQKGEESLKQGVDALKKLL